jgi:hypothetical protein
MTELRGEHMDWLDALLRAKLLGPSVCGLEVRENGMLVNVLPAVHDHATATYLALEYGLAARPSVSYVVYCLSWWV